jgi:hypothetical protein
MSISPAKVCPAKSTGLRFARTFIRGIAAFFSPQPAPRPEAGGVNGFPFLFGEGRLAHAAHAGEPIGRSARGVVNFTERVFHGAVLVPAFQVETLLRPMHRLGRTLAGPRLVGHGTDGNFGMLRDELVVKHEFEADDKVFAPVRTADAVVVLRLDVIHVHAELLALLLGQFAPTRQPARRRQHRRSESGWRHDTTGTRRGEARAQTLHRLEVRAERGLGSQALAQGAISGRVTVVAIGCEIGVSGSALTISKTFRICGCMFVITKRPLLAAIVFLAFRITRTPALEI